ncbi:MAG: 3'(2'),5'-bisphosphate nucleotidase CysQ [Candidatus Omnitrophota bacterium]|nr:MAG: 3'(2'),5'-bisphosphate nucleotidase CysQ [Candidatus Omnitrophota bacterium]
MISSDLEINKIFKIIKSAAAQILEVYNTSFRWEDKEDRSPLTLADKKSHQTILNGLREVYPNIPVFSEEGKDISYEVRKQWEYFWLVDPLDGTKEFIQRNGEFTINIALLHKDNPIFGIIYVPVTGVFYFALKGEGAYKLENSERIGEIENVTELVSISQKLPLNISSDRPFTVVGCRSHMTPETKEYFDELGKKYGNIDTISAGSSLKFCMLAERRADIYPRLGPTMEWDTAAGQIIVEEAGGEVLTVDNLKPLRYNKESLKNPWFVAKMQLK